MEAPENIKINTYCKMLQNNVRYEKRENVELEDQNIY